MYTLKQIFTSTTRIRLLKLLLFSDKSYHLREISRRISTSPIYTSKELKNLEKIKMVKKDRLANLTLYSLNKDNEIVPELKSIFKKCK
ncbi:winged helix-turn-helix transcriptional regulator [Candidatus Woesearchaeota archaeon]|nr:winged helix-turn-helix transcriptional regulator [Candidatus Woesearchaeota archaeon]